MGAHELSKIGFAYVQISLSSLWYSLSALLIDENAFSQPSTSCLRLATIVASRRHITGGNIITLGVIYNQTFISRNGEPK